VIGRPKLQPQRCLKARVMAMDRCKAISNKQLLLLASYAASGPSLAHGWAGGSMVTWIVILAMVVVGGLWVKTRRQRKSKAATYAGN
jgi:hypothetical protein